MEPPHVLKLVGGKQWMLPVKHFCYNIHSFFVAVEFHGDCKTVTKLRNSGHPMFGGIFKFETCTLDIRLDILTGCLTTHMVIQ